MQFGVRRLDAAFLIGLRRRSVDTKRRQAAALQKKKAASFEAAFEFANRC